MTIQCPASSFYRIRRGDSSRSIPFFRRIFPPAKARATPRAGGDINNMASEAAACCSHPAASHVSRRSLIRAGAIGLLGLGMNHVPALRALAAAGANSRSPEVKAKSVIYIFLSGGLSQIDTFDMKPHGPIDTRGEFKPIRTATPGVLICEHMPELAKRSNKWALVRSLTHGSNDHSLGHHIMLTGRSEIPVGFDPNRPNRSEEHTSEL